MTNNLHSTPNVTASTSITTDHLRRRIAAALARVRAMDTQELWNEILEGGGDCQMDSKETEVVISILEHEFGRELAKVEDLEPEQMTTLTAVTDLIMAQI